VQAWSNPVQERTDPANDQIWAESADLVKAPDAVRDEGPKVTDAPES